MFLDYYNVSEGDLMQFVPVNRPAALEKKGEPEIKNVSAARPIKGSSAQPVSPFALDFKPAEKPEEKDHPRAPHPPDEENSEQAFRERNNEERRKYCRRLQNIPVLYDLRAESDRRRRNQRKSDITTAIDEVV